MLGDDEPSSGPSATPMPGTGSRFLGARTRVVPPEEMQPFLSRIRSKQLAKPSEKKKFDVVGAKKYDMPYVHGSNITIVDEGGQEMDLEALKRLIKTRPEKLLKQNEKLEHSGGGFMQYYNLGLPALKGLAVDEQSNEFIVVDTCPGAGACKTYCYAKKGGYIQFKGSSMSQARVLNFLLNEPEGFKAKLISELGRAYKRAVRGKYKMALRWHDAGDFFSPDYWSLAKEVAETFPGINFYAYTKMGDIATGDKPKNFIMNFSGGALGSEEKKVDFRRTKNSRVVKRDVYGAFVQRKGGGKKGPLEYKDLDGLKARLAQEYGVDVDSVISYAELLKIPEGDEPRWNVIVKPGDGDDSAQRPDVIGTYLLLH